ncbi:MAG TPA: MFS transporter [Patescibacteria group bacterium]|nr:MFS transporter [Patescibacteria group bacterium]
MFSSLKIKNFRLYWLGMFISLIGTWIQSVAQSWLVFQLTDSAFLLGLVGFLGSIPVFMLSLFGGVVADRLNKKTILLVTQHAFMVLAFFLAVLTQLKVITPAQIMCIAVLNGTVMAFDAPCRQSVVVELVGKERLMNAIALNSAAFNSARIIGPAIAGILISAIGMSGCFYINGISFLAVIVALWVIRVNSASRNGSRTMFLQDLVEGLRFIKRNRTVLVLISMVGITSLFGIPYVILMPLFAQHILGVGVKGLGVLMSAAGVGALCAALLLAKLGDLKRKGRFLMFAAGVFSVALVFFALSKTYVLSLLALVCVGWASVTAISLINTLLQSLSPDEFRGRLMSAFMFTFAGIMPFGNLLAGSLSHVLGVSLTVAGGGCVCGAFFVFVNILYPDIRRI